MRSIRLTAAATSTLPRQVLILITAIYGLVGLFGRDPWKTEDAAGFGAMWTLAQSNWHDWVLPHIQGRSDILSGPLPYWIGGLFIKAFEGILGAPSAAALYTASCFFLTCATIWHACYLLGRRPEVQPVALALGGQPEPKDYGRTLADGALMILLACVGLAMRAHETSPALAQFLAISMLLYGPVRGLDKPIQGGIWTGLGLTIAALSAPLWFCLSLLLGLLISYMICEIKLTARWLITLSLIFSIGICLWPSLWFISNLPIESIHKAYKAWWNIDLIQFNFSSKSLGFLARNIPLYSWPVWPLAIWSLWFWRRGKHYPLGGIRNPNIALPLGIMIATLVYLLTQIDLNEQKLILLIPPMVIWACFSLPIIKRSMISFIDWFALLMFTIVSGFIWVMWFAMTTHIPESLARNVARQVPGFVNQINGLEVFAALIVTGLWISVIRWRTSRARKVIWRGVVISAAGTTLTWVLLMTLWLPTIDFAKSYRVTASRLEQVIRQDYKCINSKNLSNEELSSFIYFTKLKLKDDDQCDLLISHHSNISNNLIWEDVYNRNKSERIFLYQVKNDVH
jgi:4-amino-4-deoxy-L-arabinose transferase-like glycosyltransferase